ncbi:Alpha/beta knot methyltransferase [Mycotypha africana]|uniref:Alpha/beta knot methyltransferase n=1 Tax=Mycotypha africana TaxID=64632 RepID=UPI0023006F84|nr:Alpha/beta knot methyltransferase [Mycotypha africana]KAI8969227.1 Alpha/beta knot methyltransferase [Mycotypha africana]
MIRTKILNGCIFSSSNQSILSRHIIIQHRRNFIAARSIHNRRDSDDRSNKPTFTKHVRNIKDDKLSSQPEDKGLEYVYGFSSVVSALRLKKREILDSLYIQESAGKATTKKKDDSLLTDIVQLAKEAKIKIFHMDKGRLNNLTDNKPHQGVVLRASALQPQEVSSLTQVTENGYRVLPIQKYAKEGNKPYTFNFSRNGSNKRPFWLALDEVQDPQNFGSILRTAYFFGVDGVLVCSKNSAPLSPAVSKVSSGAVELMDVFSTTRLDKFLTESRDNGWKVIGAVGDAKSFIIPSQIASELKNCPVILVLGNEGKGLRKNIRNVCDTFISIPRATNPVLQDFGGSIDSLNVGVAAGVLIHSFTTEN